MNSLNTGTILHGKSYDYKIVRTLGQGTFGITYLANVKMTGELGSFDSEILVAVKEFFMRDFNGRDDCTVTYSNTDGAFTYYKSQFIREAENLSNLHYPGIINVLELFEQNQTAYYVMEYIPHGSLDDLIKSNGQMSTEQCVIYATQIAKALQYMHQNRILHLDIKPNNIMIKDNNQTILIDFGLSKKFDNNGNPETSTTIGYGTPGYAPIEQSNYQGYKAREFPATLDIYALGATMFKMLTGHRPPEASRILNEGFPIEELHSINIPEEIIKFIGKCMHPLRKDRYKSVDDIISELSRFTEFKGYYKKASGEKEYGTYKLQTIPVTTSIDFPTAIKIKLWDNSMKGTSYEFYLTDVNLANGNTSTHNYIKIWDKGKLIKEYVSPACIPLDVKQTITKEGLLSTVHWENEEFTTPTDKNFGTDAVIEMINKDGSTFIRRVEHAHKDWHSLLLTALEKLMETPSLNAMVHHVQTSKEAKIYKLFKLPEDTESIKVVFTPPYPYHSTSSNYEYHFIDNLKDITGLDKFSRNIFYINNINLLAHEISNLDIKVGKSVKDNHDYSEEPGHLIIDINSKSQGKIHLSLISFNTDMQGGNIYNANINELAQSIKHILLKYIPQEQNPKPKPLRLSDEKQEKAPILTQKYFFRRFKVMFFFATICAILAVPTYFFVSPTDDLHSWLWISIGTTFFATILLCIGMFTNKSQKISNVELITFLIGIAGLATYIILWICQMLFWWA